MEIEEKLRRDLDLEDDDMTVKLINLPAVMCHASNGEVFMVDTRCAPSLEATDSDMHKYGDKNGHRLHGCCLLSCLYLKDIFSAQAHTEQADSKSLRCQGPAKG